VVEPATSTAAAGGVITRWGVNSGTTADYYSINLVVLAPTGVPNGYSVVSITEALPVKFGANSTAAQIPIKAGQLIGSWGAAAALTCNVGSSTARVLTVADKPIPGSVLPIGLPTTRPPALYADVEADVDGDGFGDETQDLCPKSAKFQIACPVPVLTARKISTGKSFRASVKVDIATTVTGTATVKLPATKSKKAKTLKLKSKSFNSIAGAKKQLTIKYPNSLKNALAKLSAKKSLKLSVTITAQGVLDSSMKKFTVKLAGTK
jgi:hypothetical protein